MNGASSLLMIFFSISFVSESIIRLFSFVKSRMFALMSPRRPRKYRFDSIIFADDISSDASRICLMLRLMPSITSALTVASGFFLNHLSGWLSALHICSMVFASGSPWNFSLNPYLKSSGRYSAVTERNSAHASLILPRLLRSDSCSDSLKRVILPLSFRYSASLSILRLTASFERSRAKE